VISRRTFLRSSTLALSIPAGHGLVRKVLAAPGGGRIQAVADHSCSDCRLFYRSLPLPAARMDIAQADCLAEFSAAFDDGIDYLAGLTRNAEFVLLGQSAREHGYRLLYQGRHHYADGVLQHSIRADRDLAPALAASLAGGRHAWPRRLAAAVPRCTRARGPAHDAISSAVLQRPADSGGFLLSWVFARSDAV